MLDDIDQVCYVDSIYTTTIYWFRHELLSIYQIYQIEKTTGIA